jgi:hypothetical protein
MLTTTRHVLKADEVIFDSPFHLGFDPAAPGRDGRPPCVSDGPSVRVAQNGPEYAVLEVTCACGKTTYIRCDYGAASLPTVRQASAQE